MNLIKTYIFQVLIILTMVSCDMRKDVSVKYHFEPPFSYHTADFRPVSLNVDNAITYSIPSFYKIDERYSGIIASLLVKYPDKAEKDVLSDLQQVSVSVVVRNKSGDVILNLSAQLNELSHKFLKDRVLAFHFLGGDFSNADPDKIDLTTISLDPKHNLAEYTLSVRLTEIRGK